MSAERCRVSLLYGLLVLPFRCPELNKSATILCLGDGPVNGRNVTISLAARIPHVCAFVDGEDDDE